VVVAQLLYFGDAIGNTVAAIDQRLGQFLVLGGAAEFGHDGQGLGVGAPDVLQLVEVNVFERVHRHAGLLYDC
jgi:hypothetical protein